MFFERINKFRRSLAFRLTLFYTTMFTISSFIAFLIFYEIMTLSIHNRTDNSLKEKAKEFSLLIASKGIGSLKEEMIHEANAIGPDKVFFRCLTMDGEEIISSDIGPWRNTGVSRIALKHMGQGKPLLETLKLPGVKYKVRVLYEIAGPEIVVHIGQTLKEDEDLFKEFREVFRTGMTIVLVLATLGGWFMARRALSGVEEVTKTAVAISEGAMENRVPLSGRGDEIDRLAGVFNHMLNRIQSLMIEMREVTDNIAHDLKTPITRIRGLTEIALTREKSLDEYQTMAESIAEECDRLSAMINTMLDISETKAGVRTLDVDEVDLSALVKEAGDLFQPLAKERGLQVELNTPPQCLLQGDKGKLQRVFANLLDNAIKYTPTGGSITVAFKEYPKEVAISVSDTGIGISSEEIVHIFDRFFRADGSRSQPGAGLGLSLVRAIVRRHGGEIKVNSSPGAGSTFTVVLPRIKSQL